MAGGSGKWWRRGWARAAWRKNKGLLGGAHMSTVAEEEAQRGRHETKEKTPLCKGTKGSQTDWASKGRWWPRKGSGLVRWPRPARLDSNEGLKNKFDFQISMDFRFW
jgi:hypothetical protein